MLHNRSLQVKRLSWQGVWFRTQSKEQFNQYVFIERARYCWDRLSLLLFSCVCLCSALTIFVGAWMIDQGNVADGSVIVAPGIGLLFLYWFFAHVYLTKIMIIDVRSIVLEYRKLGRCIQREEIPIAKARLGIHDWHFFAPSTRGGNHDGWVVIVHFPQDHFALVSGSPKKVKHYLKTMPDPLRAIPSVPSRSLYFGSQTLSAWYSPFKRRTDQTP